MSEDFGSYLKHQRELRGVPLDEIAQATKISARFLRALEENRFEDLPGEVFVKGFIRSYGQAIGSNVDELLAAYHESSSRRQDAGTADTAIAPPREEPPQRHSAFPMTAVLGFGTALLIIAGGVYWFTYHKENTADTSPQTRLATPPPVDNTLPEIEGELESTESAEAITTEDSAPVSQPPAAVEPEKPPRPADSATAPAEAPGPQTPVKNTVTVSEKDAIMKDLQEQAVPQSVEPETEVAMEDATLNLVIRVSENSWFNLTVDDFRDQDFILPPGGSKTIQAKNGIVMTIGNRRATQLFLNGQPLDLPESPDNVIRNLTVNAEQLN